MKAFGLCLLGATLGWLCPVALGIVAVQTGRLDLFKGDAEMYYIPLLGVLIPLPFVAAGALLGARTGWRRWGIGGSSRAVTGALTLGAVPVVAASVAIPAVAVYKFQSIPDAVLSGMSESTAFAAMPTLALTLLFAAAGAWQASRMAT